MKRLYHISATILGVIGLSVLLVACGKTNAESKSQQAGEMNVVNVSVEEVVLKDFTETIQITGAIESYEDIMVPAEEGGRMVEWKAPKGASVKKGQVLARLDDAVLRAAYDAANANYQLAEITYAKQSKVYEEQAISEWQLKSYQYQRDAAKAQADLAKARLDKTLIKSPTDGVLNNRFVEQGEMATSGAPIAHVIATTRLRIGAGIPERYAGAFKMGDQVHFTVDAVPNQTFTGKVSFIGSAVNKDNRSIPVEVFITPGTVKLKPEMIATMRITLAARPNSIVVPEDYLQQVDKDRFVVFVDEDGFARERSVEIGAVNGGKVLVQKGLDEGDRVITLGHQNVTDGQKIIVQK